jgi:hypothetical protein
MAQAASHAKVSRLRPGVKRAPQRVVITVSVDEDVLRQFDIEARREARTRSSQIALLMRQWVENRRSA